MNFILITNINLDNYSINLYKIDTDTNNINIETINGMVPQLNAQQYAKEIVEILELVPGVSKIEIFDNNNKLLISSGPLLADDLSN